MDQWQSNPSVIVETIRASKSFLDSELAKYESWDEARINKSINTLFGNAGNFERTKQAGVGQTTILKFLGGNWKQWMIQELAKTAKVSHDTIMKVKKIKSSRQLRVLDQYILHNRKAFYRHHK